MDGPKKMVAFVNGFSDSDPHSSKTRTSGGNCCWMISIPREKVDG